AGALAMRWGFMGAGGGETVDAAQADLAVATLKRIAERAEAHGAASLFVLATGQAPIVAPDEPVVAAKAVVERAAQVAGAVFVDLTPSLRAAARASSKPLYYPLDGHWTAEGHAVAAEALA